MRSLARFIPSFRTPFRGGLPLLLLLILLLIVAKNHLERRNISLLGNSICTVYEDRLIAESYLYELSLYLHAKRRLLDNCRSTGEWASLRSELEVHNEGIDRITGDFARTKLTRVETSRFDDLLRHIERIRQLEAGLFLEGGPSDSSLREPLRDAYETADRDLALLSAIQLDEGREVVRQSRRIMADASLLQTIEIILLILLGMLLQRFISRSRVLRSPVFQRPELN